MLWDYSEPLDNKTWLNGSVKTKTVKVTDDQGKETVKKKWGRRRLILGRWREIKLEMYDRYLHEMTYDPDPTEPFEDEDQLDEVPF